MRVDREEVELSGDQEDNGAHGFEAHITREPYAWRLGTGR